MTARHILDLRAGARWSPAVIDVLARAAESAWGNPRHPSSEGRRAATWVEAAAVTVSRLSGFPQVAFFADRQSALMACLRAHPGARVTASATHRTRVLDHVDDVVPVDEHGVPSWGRPALALEQAANEETGVIDPRSPAAIRILDASNSFGRVAEMPDADHVIADATAWGAPGQVTMVLGHRPVESAEPPAVPLIAMAVQLLGERWDGRSSRAAQEHDAMTRFERAVTASVPDVQFHGRNRVPHIRSFSVLHLDAETLMRALDEAGFVVGSGSACVADGTPSHVLAAMGCITHGNLRIALPVDLDLGVLDPFVAVLRDSVARLRREAGVEDL